MDHSFEVVCLIDNMILDITSHGQRRSVKRPTWRQELRRELYKKNLDFIKQVQEDSPSQANAKRQAEDALFRIFDNESISLTDNMQTSTCYSYYSSYIPLKKESKFDDEIAMTFPYIKHIQEEGRMKDMSLLLRQISEQMQLFKIRGEIDKGWQLCLNAYLCDLDSLTAAELYLEFKKHGTQKLKELHKKYGGECKELVFFQRIRGSAHYFKKYIPLNKSPFSIEAYEQINEITMPKTMKQLFCWICMTYDCGQHAVEDDLKDKHYQYVSPRNVRSVEENLKNAVTVCLAYRQLLENGRVGQAQPCSAKCYKHLTRQEWQSLQLNRVKLLSPMVKGVIKLGIDMFSYSPCDIWFLLTQEKITCAHVFLFFVEEYNIFLRLENKLTDSEHQMLLRQKLQENYIIQPIKKQRKKKIISVDHKCNKIISCTHYFRGQEPIDIHCQSCNCREKGYCLPQCLCDDTCPIRKRGCNCKKEDCRTKKCICYSNNEECNPELCRNCFGGKKSNCKNHGIMSQQFKKAQVGRSTIPGAGLGLFAAEDIKKGELLTIYSGEIIDSNIDLLRQSLSVDNTFYNFGVPEGAIDARFMGNLSRFINHADQGRQNLESKTILTEGRYKIGFYATRDIEREEQLFFDYDGEGQLYKNYKDKYPFIQDKKRGKA